MMNLKRHTVMICLCVLAPAGLAGQDGIGIAARHRAVFTSPPTGTPADHSVDGPLLGNGDLLVALGGNPDGPRFHIGKNDLWRMRSGGGAAPRPLARLDLDMPALAGASYRVEQTLADATTVATFERGDLALRMRSWVAADDPLLVMELSAAGGTIPVKAMLHEGGVSEAPLASLRGTGNRINLGREQHGKARWYLHGLLDEVEVYGTGLSDRDVARLGKGQELEARPIRRWTFEGNRDGDDLRVGVTPVEGKKGRGLAFDGRASYVDSRPLAPGQAVSISAFVLLRDADATQYILSQGEWNQGWSLGLSSGKLRMAVGNKFAQTAGVVPVGRWVHVAGVFDGSRIHVYVDGVAETKDAGERIHRERDGLLWIERRIEDGVRIPAAAACAFRAIGQGDRSFSVEPGKPVTLVAAVASRFGREDYAKAAVAAAREATPRSLDAARQRHESWWRDYWNKSFVEIPDDFLEQRYYLSLYGIGSASRNPSFPPGIFGWVTTDSPKWNGDYHMNYNHVSPFYGLGVSNRIEQLDPCIQPILDAREPCLELAKSQLGTEGVYMPVGIGPKGSIGRGALMQKSNGAYSCVPIAERWYTTCDPDFAGRAYPFVRDVATFWEHWLKFEDGRYVIHRDAVHENSGQDINPVVSLALVRMVMNLALDMSSELGLDGRRRAKWVHVRDHLSGFPTCRLGDLKGWWPEHLPRTGENREIPIFRYTETGTEWWRNNTVGVQHIFPADGIGLDSDPGLLERGRNQIMVMNRWVDFNGMNSFYAAAARVGYDPEVILRELEAMQRRIGRANGMIKGNPHGIEEFSIVPNALQEMLMQSHEGVIRVFPVWPRDRDARFETLRARGAFLVSSELKNGDVREVRIRSERGRDCTLVNPWPGRRVRATGPARTVTLEGERFTLRTAAGETWRLRKADAPEGDDVR